MQDTWLGVIQGIWAFEGRSSLKTRIYRILINRAKSRAVREGRTAPVAGLDPGIEAAAAVAPDRFQPADHPAAPGHWAHPPPDLGPPRSAGSWPGRARELLQTAIEGLPDNQRLVLILRDVDGCSTQEV